MVNVVKQICIYVGLLGFSVFSVANPFGDMKSATLTQRAWVALEEKDFQQVHLMTEKCIELYQKEAIKQQNALSDFAPTELAHQYWALNDVATCLFIKAKALVMQDKPGESSQLAREVTMKYSFAQAFDPAGNFFWKVGNACKDLLLSLETQVDFGDYTSEFLTTRAWEMLASSEFEKALIYSQKCIELYENEARKQQDSLSQFAAKADAFNYWALNDVGTCYFIRGESYLKSGDHVRARDQFQYLVDNFSFAQCYDTKDFFWKPAVTARGKIAKISAMDI